MIRDGIELHEHGGDGLPIPSGDPACVRYLQMNKMDGEKRHNKFYSGEWFADDPTDKKSRAAIGTSLFIWAAVGEKTAAYMTKRHTRAQFDTQIGSKISKGYNEIVLAQKTIKIVAAGENAIVPAATINPRVNWIVDSLFKEANESTDTYLDDSIASRLLAPEQIAKGRNLLVQIEKAWNRYQLTNKTSDRLEYNGLLEQYMANIPVRVQRSRGYDPDAIQTHFARHLSDHYDHLLQLEAQLADNVIVKTAAAISTPKLAMANRLTYIEKSDPLWVQIEREVLRTAVTKDTRVMQREKPLFRIDEIFSVHLPEERQRWSDFVSGWVGRNDNEKTIGRLYHATRSANARHIVGKDGLIISPIAANGSRFGRGLYFADFSARSYSYTGIQWNSSCPRIMFVVDVALGRMRDFDRDNNSLKSAPAGYDSVRGVKSHSNMDEFIVYQREQATIRLMLCISPN